MVRTPAESLDLNPIEENLWHILKEFIQREVKPKTKQELVDGIQEFGEQRLLKSAKRIHVYIGHLKKVIPKVIKLESAATEYACVLMHISLVSLCH